MPLILISTSPVHRIWSAFLVIVFPAESPVYSVAPLHLRLRLIKPEELETSMISHGWLEDGGRLVLRQQPLLQRLEQYPGYGCWREAGGDLSLIEGTQP